MSVEIESIAATPDFNTSNRKLHVVPATPTSTPIYDVTNPPGHDDSATGSDFPCTFIIPDNPVALVNVNLRVTAAVTGLPQGQQYVLQASLNGTSILQSVPLTYPNMVAPSLQFINPAQVGFCRLAGDWQWSIEVNNDDRNLAIVATSTTTTRLELCFVKTEPPQGPVLAPDNITPTAPDFGGVYPVDIFRLFLPDWAELQSWTNGFWVNYLQRSMDVIWNLGLQRPAEFPNWDVLLRYETISGGAAYVDNQYGGVFQLRRFANNFLNTLNCYDLAALAQLAVCFLGTPGTLTDPLNSHWITCNNYGWIVPGPLFGWPQYPECNSPFFAGGKSPYYPPPQDALRSPFWKHAWIEVQVATQAETVLDATHGLLIGTQTTGPAAGTQDRDTYLAAQSDRQFQNPRIFDFNPTSTLSRIGVTAIGAVSFAVARPVSVIVVPTGIATAEPTPPRPVNNSSCDASTMLGLLQTEFATANLAAEDIQVGPAGCQKLWAYDSLGLSRPHTTRQLADLDGTSRLLLEITNLETDSDADSHYESLTNKILANVPESERRDSSALPVPSVRIVSDVAFIRNNTVVRIFSPATTVIAAPDNLSDQLYALAIAIDKHLANGAVPKASQSRPDASVPDDLVARNVRLNEIITLGLPKVSAPETVVVAQVSTPRHGTSAGKLLQLGPMGADGQIKFLAQAAGVVEVTLSAAHPKTLAVESSVITVTVA